MLSRTRFKRSYLSRNDNSDAIALLLTCGILLILYAGGILFVAWVLSFIFGHFTYLQWCLIVMAGAVVLGWIGAAFKGGSK